MFAIGIAAPIVPLYASSLGASWTEIGLMGTSWGVAFMLLAFVMGKVSDRFGRKPQLIISASLSAIAAFLYLVSSSVTQIILVRILEGAVWALFWPAAEALATEIAEPRMVGRAIGMTTATYGIAYAASSLAGGSITGVVGYPLTLSIYLGLSLFSILVALILLQGPQPRRESHAASLDDERLDSASLRSRTILLAYFLGGAYTFGLGIVLTLFSVFAKTLGATVFLIGVLFGLFWLGRIGGSIGGGRLSDRHGRGVMAVAAMVGSAIGFTLVAISTAIQVLVAGVAILGVSIGTAFPVGVALVSDNIRQSVRGYAMGFFETSCAAGFMLAATIGGVLADLYSPRAPYVLAASISLASAIIFSLGRAK